LLSQEHEVETDMANEVRWVFLEVRLEKGWRWRRQVEVFMLQSGS